MIDRIAPQSLTPVAPLTVPGAAESRPAFSELLTAAMQRVEASGQAATEAIEGFLNGSAGDIHSAALAAQKASLQFEYFLQVRNKVVQAYQEIMRMQL